MTSMSHELYICMYVLVYYMLLFYIVCFKISAREKANFTLACSIIRTSKTVLN